MSASTPADLAVTFRSLGAAGARSDRRRRPGGARGPGRTSSQGHVAAAAAALGHGRRRRRHGRGDRRPARPTSGTSDARGPAPGPRRRRLAAQDHRRRRGSRALTRPGDRQPTGPLRQPGDVGGLGAVGVGRQDASTISTATASEVSRSPRASTLASFQRRAPRAVDIGAQRHARPHRRSTPRSPSSTTRARGRPVRRPPPRRHHDRRPATGRRDRPGPARDRSPPGGPRRRRSPT